MVSIELEQIVQRCSTRLYYQTVSIRIINFS